MRGVLLGVVASASAALAALSACGSSAPPLHKAGSDGDEGHGLLGKQSIQLMTSEDETEPEEEAPEESYSRGYDEEMPTVDDAPAAFGGDAYGGQAYAEFVVRPWSVQPRSREPSYKQAPNLVGVLEGTVSWRGAIPAQLKTGCGPIERLRVGKNRGLAGVIVYIASVRVGRSLESSDSRPLGVGGTVVKRGCALAPAAQVAAPLPVAVVVHNDAKAARIRVTRGAEEPQIFALQPAGHAGVSLQQGFVRVEAEDGTLAAAFVLGLETSYYAITDDRGHYRIDELAPGSYDVTFWQAPRPTLVGGRLTYGAPVVTVRRITVPAKQPARLDLALGR